MDAEGPLRSLENVFTQPSIARIGFLAVLVGLAFILEYGTGFSHHYDVRSQIQELSQLKEIAAENPLVSERIDSLRAETLSRIERRQAEMSRNSLWYWQIVSALILPAVLVGMELVWLASSGYSSRRAWRGISLSLVLCFATYTLADAVPVPVSFTAAVLLPISLEVILVVAVLLGIRLVPNISNPFSSSGHE